LDRVYSDVPYELQQSVNSSSEIYSGRRTYVQRTALQVAGLQCSEYFDVLLTVHFSIILVINNFMHKFLYYNKFILCLYMFRAPCAHHQEVKIVLYSIWYHHACRWPSGAQVKRGLLSQPVHRTATYQV